MNNKIYAGVGARNTPKYILYLMKIIGIYLASMGYKLHTGAAQGADQAFAEGAISNNGNVILVLPWSTYEHEWIGKLITDSFKSKSEIYTTVFNKNTDLEAIKSVHKLHPNASKLKDSVIALHARNYLILRNAKFAICYTENGTVTGGTGQAIRIMENFGRKIFNLGKEEDIQQVIKVLGEM